MNSITSAIFDGFAPFPKKLTGWNGTEGTFKDLVEELRPSHIIEVGTWLGQSAITMAKAAKELKLSTKITCVDTWLGSTEFWSWLKSTSERDLMLKHGYPQVYFQFLSNVVHEGVQDMILPFPTTSLIAARCMRTERVTARLIYIDGSHDYEDVLRDCNEYWSLLEPGGVLFGDDWSWTSVRAAVENFAKIRNLRLERAGKEHWTLRKACLTELCEETPRHCQDLESNNENKTASTLGVYSMSRYARKTWDAVRQCLQSFAPVDHVHIQLWDYPPEEYEFVRSINPNWTILGCDRSPTENAAVNIWHSRGKLLEAFVSSKFPHALLIEDDIKLNADILELAKYCETGALTVLSKGVDEYGYDHALGWLENGLIISKDVCRSILEDFRTEPVMHDDRFLYLLTYLHGFRVKTVCSARYTHHLEAREKRRYVSWTYEDKRMGATTPYGNFTRFVTPCELGKPGRPTLNAEGVARARRTWEKRNGRRG